MDEIIDFFNTSHHFEHLGLGFLLGLFSDTFYCAEFSSICVGSALEVKDYKWGGEFDFIDLLLVILGGNVGFILRTLMI